MAQTVLKPTDYQERSEDFAKRHSVNFEAVKSLLSEKALKAAEKVSSLMEADGDAQLLRLQLDSAKAVLKYNGLETENVHHSGKVEFEPFVISRGDHG